MKYYIYSVSILVVVMVFVALLPTGVNVGERVLVQSVKYFQIPKNNAEVAGIQKYNIPPYSNNIPIPYLTARSVLVKDLTTGTILYQHNPNLPLPIASTTKIMTGLVAIEYFQPNSELLVQQGAAAGGASVGLVSGEVLTFRSLLYGMLLNSGNDAAFTIAENYQGGILGFISAMNKKSLELQLQNTHFDNPAGFDSNKHYSSAADLAVITEKALENDQLAKIFATKETEIISLDKKHKHQLRNLNKLLSDISGVLGVKTGYTEAAKENLVTLVERDNHRVITVVLGSNDRFGESTNLIEWIYTNFVWQE